MDTLPLRDVIRGLRTELVEAVAEARGEQVRFELGPIELEFQVVVQRDLEGGAKLGFHILAASAELNTGVKGSDERVQRVKFILNPHSSDKTPVEISRRSGMRNPGNADE